MPPLVAIVGETASGKSDLGLELAERFNGEIICADSWTVYKGFDIGTAKPTLLEQRRVPYHLLDIIDASSGFSAAAFQRLTYQAIDDIYARGKLPLLVGGSGLYIDSVFFGYEFLPAASTELRKELNDLTLGELLKRAEDMHLSTDMVDTHNKRRVIRLIENNGRRASKQELQEFRPKTLVFGLQTPRDLLEAKIERRVDKMLASGLEREVRQMSDKYGWDVAPMKGIGYREWKAYCNGTQSLAQTRLNIMRDTRLLAKKQRTWFKRNKSIHWLSTDDKTTKAVELITTFLNT